MEFDGSAYADNYQFVVADLMSAMLAKTQSRVLSPRPTRGRPLQHRWHGVGRQMTNVPVRFAIIGVTQPHAAGYAESLLHMAEAEIIAGYDWVNLDLVREKLPEQLSGLPLYDDVAALLDRERPEAVVICMPPSQTPAIIELAASRGVHIIAEKPCARTAAEFLPTAN